MKKGPLEPVLKFREEVVAEGGTNFGIVTNEVNQYDTKGKSPKKEITLTLGGRGSFFPMHGQGPIVFEGTSLPAVARCAAAWIKNYKAELKKNFAEKGLSGCHLSCIRG